MLIKMKKYILTLDQGTTSSRAIIFDKEGNIISKKQYEFKQFYPEPGFVEHDPEEILSSQFKAMNDCIADLNTNEIAAIAITNQRETTVVWDADTGKPIYNAIVWQCRRTAKICDELKKKGLTDYISDTTGLVIDAYFSATKIKWILDHVTGAREKADKGKLRFGTIDTWLLWNLTKGKVHATDVTNASRTMLFDINNLCFDKTLLKELNIPESMMPKVLDTSGIFGYANIKGFDIPIAAMVGDQQAALFGQTCFNKGEGKNTYGTGCFILINTGEKRVKSKSGLLTTIAWSIDKKVTYALEGSVFNAGAAIQWLRDGLRIIKNAHQSDIEGMKTENSGGVYFVPAFSGLGAPYWDMYATGMVIGINRGTTKQHFIRAVLDSIAYQSRDIFDAMTNDSGIELKELNVDGGASVSPVIMQFQADILRVSVNRPKNIESTAIGGAFLAGLAVGFWKSNEEIKNIRVIDKIYYPKMDKQESEKLYKKWQRAVERCRSWEEA